MRNRGNYLVRKGMKISLGAAAVLALALTAGAQSRSARHGGVSAGTSNGIGGGASLGVSGGIQGGISGGVGGGIGWGVEGGISQGLGNLAGLGESVDLSGLSSLTELGSLASIGNNLALLGNVDAVEFDLQDNIFQKRGTWPRSFRQDSGAIFCNKIDSYDPWIQNTLLSTYHLLI